MLLGIARKLVRPLGGMVTTRRKFVFDGKRPASGPYSGWFILPDSIENYVCKFPLYIGGMYLRRRSWSFAR
jgi:hypothetical protein